MCSGQRGPDEAGAVEVQKGTCARSQSACGPPSAEAGAGSHQKMDARLVFDDMGRPERPLSYLLNLSQVLLVVWGEDRRVCRRGHEQRRVRRMTTPVVFCYKLEHPSHRSLACQPRRPRFPLSPAISPALNRHMPPRCRERRTGCNPAAFLRAHQICS